MNFNVSPALLNPSAQDLRKFGLLSAVFVSVIFGVFFPWVLDNQTPIWPWVISAIFSMWALLHPTSMKVVYIPWIHVGAVLGWVNSRILLGFVFYCFVTPASFLTKLFGKKLIQGLEKEQPSYRETPKPTDNKQMENPY